MDLNGGGSFGYLGFDFRRVRSRAGASKAFHVEYWPKMKKRTALLERLRAVFRSHRSQPVEGLIDEINPILRGWVNYFRMGYSARCFAYVSSWVEERVRRHLWRNSAACSPADVGSGLAAALPTDSPSAAPDDLHVVVGARAGRHPWQPNPLHDRGVPRHAGGHVPGRDPLRAASSAA